MNLPMALVGPSVEGLAEGLLDRGIPVIDVSEGIPESLPGELTLALYDMSDVKRSGSLIRLLLVRSRLILLYSSDTISSELLPFLAEVKMEVSDPKEVPDFTDILQDPRADIVPSDYPALYPMLWDYQRRRLPAKRRLLELAFSPKGL